MFTVTVTGIAERYVADALAAHLGQGAGDAGLTVTVTDAGSAAADASDFLVDEGSSLYAYTIDGARCHVADFPSPERARAAGAVIRSALRSWPGFDGSEG